MHDNKIVEDFTKKVSVVNTALRQFIQGRIKELEINLTFEMLQVLACLWNKDGINQQEIANLTVKDKASITYLIDNLTSRGLVYRLEDQGDRRNKLILLTDQGKLFRHKVQPIIGELYTVAGKHLNLEEIKKCMDILNIVESNLKDGR
jgi:DNA-binding MarR family transcriptional regulator